MDIKSDNERKQKKKNQISEMSFPRYEKTN